MRSIYTIMLALMVLISGCITVEGPSDSDAPGDAEPDTPTIPADTDDDTDSTNAGGIATGGDPEDDTRLATNLDVPEGAKWTQTSHHFRIMLKVDGTELNRDIRMTVDVGDALDNASLRWVGPGVPLIDFDPDPRSVVIQQISGAGRATATLDVAARQAGDHALEIVFHHIGGLYVVYFDTVATSASGGPTGSFEAPEDATARRAKVQWQGDDLWGLNPITKNVTHGSADEIILITTLDNQGRTTERTPQSINISLAARAPDGWSNVTLNPSEVTSVSTSKTLRLTATVPASATGTEIVYLDVTAGGVVVTAQFNVLHT